MNISSWKFSTACVREKRYAILKKNHKRLSVNPLHSASQVELKRSPRGTRTWKLNPLAADNQHRRAANFLNNHN